MQMRSHFSQLTREFHTLTGPFIFFLDISKKEMFSFPCRSALMCLRSFGGWGTVTTVPRLTRGTRLRTAPLPSATRAASSAVGGSHSCFRHMVASICVTVGEIIMIFRLYMGSFSMGLLCR